MRILRSLLIPIALSFGWIPSLTSAGPCVPGSLDSYIALGATGCEVGDATFASFAALDVPFGVTPIASASVMVGPLTDDALRPGLAFELDQAAATEQLFGIWIAYNVLGATLRGAELGLEGSSVIEDGAVVGIEDLCLGGAFDAAGSGGCTGILENLVVFDVGVDGELDAGISFDPITALAVVKHVDIDGGLEGSASLQRATNRFTIPEPGTALLIGASWLLIAMRRSTQR